MNFYALGYAIGTTLSEPKTFTPLDFGVKARKRCRTGYNCGGSCISTKKKCRVALSGEAKNFAQYVQQNKGKLTAIQKEKAKKQNIEPKTQSRLKEKKPKKATTSQTKKATTQHPPNSAAFFIEKGQKTLRLLDSASIEKLAASAKEVRSLMDNFDLLRKQSEKLQNHENEKASKIISQLRQNWDRINDLITENEPIFKKVHDQLLQKSRVSDDQIKQEIGRLNISQKALNAHPELKSDLESYIKMTGKIPNNLLTIDFIKDRAYADMSNQRLNIGEPRSSSTESRGVIFHELSHFEEFNNSNIGEAAAEWRRQKASDFAKNGQPEIKELKTLIPGYVSDEKAFQDKYIDPYVGRIYPPYLGRPVSEVVSVGVEHFASPRKMTELYLKDPSHFELSLGILSSLREN